jgi:hypothetical protein
VELSEGRLLSPTPCNPGGPDELEITAELRQIFLSEMVELLVDYETFLLLPETKEEWLDGMKGFCFEKNHTFHLLHFAGASTGFDKMSFLSDQPPQNAAFLVEFLETQMFAAFVDCKVSTALVQTNF